MKLDVFQENMIECYFLAVSKCSVVILFSQSYFAQLSSFYFFELKLHNWVLECRNFSRGLRRKIASFDL